MNDMRKLMETVEKLDESYHSRLAAAADDIAYYNKRMPDDELIELIRTQLGDMAAQYISDKLAGGETDWKDNLRKTLANMDKPNYSWSKNVEGIEESAPLGNEHFQDGLPSEGDLVRIEGGEYDGKRGTVLNIQGDYDEEGHGVLTHTIKLQSGETVKVDLVETHYNDTYLIKVGEYEYDDEAEDEFAYSNPFESLEEAKGNVVEVPAGLRGEGHNKTGNATSDDAEEFIRELGIDDQIDTDVVDPETGELLFRTGTTKRKESKKGNYQVLNYDDFTRGAKLREPESPVMHSGWDWENDIEKKQDNAWELLRELRDSDFYNVVWKNAAELVGKPDMGTDDEEWGDLDYDVDVEIPVAIKRKDGKRFTEDDHDNFREIVSAVKKASTMGNFGIQYAGTSNKGTVARFVPSFM